MANRSPARWLAPSALVAAAITLVVVLSTSLTSDSSTDAPAPTLTAATTAHRRAPAPKATPVERTTGPTGPTGVTTGQGTYTVQSGDILTTVAAKTGVPVERLRELNPGLDANNMTVGQVIRLQP